MTYYHVIVSLKSRPNKDALIWDLSELDLKNEVVKPYLNGQKFVCHEELVKPDDVETMKITKTDTPLFKLIGGSYVPTYTQVWLVANEADDITTDFLPELEKKVKIPLKSTSLSKNIFIVHGRNHKPMKELRTMLKEFGLNLIVLHEQPSGSRTIVEKLEKYSDVGYAFVILTPDDVLMTTEFVYQLDTKMGKLSDKEISGTGQVIYRARQNVVLEFGYFIGLLGRDKVCCLYKGDIDLPSDMDGIVYVPFKDSVEEARDMIIKELKEAGYEIKL